MLAQSFMGATAFTIGKMFKVDHDLISFGSFDKRFDGYAFKLDARNLTFVVVVPASLQNHGIVMLLDLLHQVTHSVFGNLQFQHLCVSTLRAYFPLYIVTDFSRNCPFP
jgi:hypothetical protein